MMSDDECKEILRWIDSLEIQEAAELKEWWENKRPNWFKRLLRRLAR